VLPFTTGVIEQVLAQATGVTEQVVAQATGVTEQVVAHTIGLFKQVVPQTIGAHSVPVNVGLLIVAYWGCKCEPQATCVLPVPNIAHIVPPEVIHILELPV
jgi:hypothetical protein